MLIATDIMLIKHGRSRFCRVNIMPLHSVCVSRPVLESLHIENVDVVVQDLGDICPRKVLCWSITGRLRVKRSKALHNDTLLQREQNYLTH